MAVTLPLQIGKAGRHIPECYQHKASLIYQQIQSGIHYQKIGGKKLRCNPAIVSFPLGRRYRLVAIYDIKRAITVKIMTHESYNSFYRR